MRGASGEAGGVAYGSALPPAPPYATPPDGKTEWLEDGVVERARERYDLPVTHVVVDAR